MCLKQYRVTIYFCVTGMCIGLVVRTGDKDLQLILNPRFTAASIGQQGSMWGCTSCLQVMPHKLVHIFTQTCIQKCPPQRHKTSLISSSTRHSNHYNTANNKGGLVGF